MQSCNITPQLTMGGRSPKPKKLSAVSPRIIPGILRVKLRDNDMARKSRDQMTEEDPAMGCAEQSCSNSVILFSQRQYLAADYARETGPSQTDSRQP